MWRIYNSTTRNESHGEEGRIRVVVQRMGHVNASQNVIDEARTHFSKYQGAHDLECGAHVNIKNIDIEDMRPRDVLSRVRAENSDPTAFKYDVFISYHALDRDVAEYIADSLRAKGHDVFLADEALLPGDTWPEMIRDGLLRSREFCLVWGRKTPKREWVNTEWGVAWALDRHIVSVLIDGMSANTLPDRLRNKQAIRLVTRADENERRLKKYADSVLSRRRGYLKGSIGVE